MRKIKVKIACPTGIHTGTLDKGLLRFMKLAENGVKTLDDFADLAGDELVEMLGNSMLSIDVANEMIMAARAHWFEDEK